MSEASSRFPWPPVLTLACLGFGAAGTLLHALPVVAAPARGLLFWVGCALGLLGLGLAGAAHRLFHRAGTETLPTRPTTAIVEAGIYRYTRNPMYLGMLLVILGAGLAGNSWWVLVTLPAFVMAITRLAIEREERYLTAKFGATYTDYKARVRRWL